MIDSVRSNSFIIGGQVGFNYQMGIAVVGVEADGSWTKTAQSATAPDAGSRKYGTNHELHLLVRNGNGARRRGLG